MKIDLFFYFLSLSAVKKSNKRVIDTFVAIIFQNLNGFLCNFRIENEVFIQKTSDIDRKGRQLWDFNRIILKFKKCIAKIIKERVSFKFSNFSAYKNNNNEKNYSINPEFDEYIRFFSRGYD